MQMLPGRLRRPRPRRRGAVVGLARALWTLPTNLIGHAAGLLVSGRPPRRVRGPAAAGWLYPIRSGLGLDWVGAVALGHAILYRPGLLDDAAGGGTPTARLILAHELAHTRQHDLLGPLYLPLHILAQVVSAILMRGRTPIVSRVHDANPLEQTFICIPASAPRAPLPDDLDLEELLRDFGV
jgi:hypothetical protein